MLTKPDSDPSASGAHHEVPYPSITCPESRASRKRRAIAEAAIRVFIRDGFVGASVDAIASEARVSKPTIYAHFGNKESLFRSILSTIMETTRDDFATWLDEPLGASGDLKSELRDYGRRWVRAVLRPDILALHRLVICEAQRFPELGETWYEAGPAYVDCKLARQLACLSEQGMLDVPDPMLAAQHFGYLLIGPLQTMLLFKPREQVTDDEINRFVEAGLSVFFARYGPKIKAATDRSVSTESTESTERT